MGQNPYSAAAAGAEGGAIGGMNPIRPKKSKPPMGENMARWGAIGGLGAGAVGLGAAKFLNQGEWDKLDRFAKTDMTPVDTYDRRPLVDRYIQTASDAASVRPGGMSMRDFMHLAHGSQLSNALNHIHGHGWDTGMLNHYGEFERGPLYGWMQLQHESHDGPKPMWPGVDTLRQGVAQSGDPYLHNNLIGDNTTNYDQVLSKLLPPEQIYDRPGSYWAKPLVDKDKFNQVMRNIRSSAGQEDWSATSTPSFKMDPQTYQARLDEQMIRFLKEKGFTPAAHPQPQTGWMEKIIPSAPQDDRTPPITFGSKMPDVPREQQMQLLNEFRQRMGKTDPGMALRMQLDDQMIGTPGGTTITTAPGDYGGFINKVRGAVGKIGPIGMGLGAAGAVSLAAWWAMRQKRKQQEAQAAQAQAQAQQAPEMDKEGGEAASAMAPDLNPGRAMTLRTRRKGLPAPETALGAAGSSNPYLHTPKTLSVRPTAPSGIENTALGVGIGGLGLGGALWGLNKGISPEDEQRVRSFTDLAGSGTAKDPRKLYDEYVVRGSQAAQTRPWGMNTGALMSAVNGFVPSLRHASGQEVSDHYTEFAKGPIPAYMQLQKEHEGWLEGVPAMKNYLTAQHAGDPANMDAMTQEKMYRGFDPWLKANNPAQWAAKQHEESYGSAKGGWMQDALQRYHDHATGTIDLLRKWGPTAGIAGLGLGAAGLGLWALLRNHRQQQAAQPAAASLQNSRQEDNELAEADRNRLAMSQVRAA